MLSEVLSFACRGHKFYKHPFLCFFFMARLYSKKKGVSGSKRPVKRIKPSWVNYDQKVVEQLILKLGKTGLSAGQIGLILRDSYGIPDVKAITGKRLHMILAENQIIHKLPDDLIALIKKDIAIVKHIDSHKKDGPSLRGLILTESKIGRLAKYYKRTGKLPEDWKFDRSKAKLFIE